MKEYRKDQENIVIPDEYNDENDILKCLFQSVLDVDKGYIFYHTKKGGVKPQTERVFAYELYRRWAQRVEDQFSGEYLINGEPEKSVSAFRSTNHQYPDLVLHHSQSDTDFQGVVCEVKRKEGFTNTSFRTDIEKLGHFVGNRNCLYRFRFGVFVLVGADMSDISKAIKRIDKEILKFNRSNKTLEKIICLCYDGEVLKSAQLSELVH
jgi:hypothetical protein